MTDWQPIDDALAPDPAETPKPWWQSRAVLGALVTVAASAAAIAGYTVNVETTTEILLSFATLVGGALSWWGRVQAERPISRTQVLPGVNLKGQP